MHLRPARIIEWIALALVFACLPACNLKRPSTPTPPPSPTADRPRAQILFPAHNRQVVEGVVFDIEILASDSAGIDRIELYVDEQLLQSSRSDSGAVRNYRVTMNWFAKGIGWHKFSAVAYREDDTPSHPHTIALEVIPPG